MNATYRSLYRILFSLQISIFGWPAFSQVQLNQFKIDSMEKVLQNTSRNDTAVVPLLKTLSKINIYKDARQAIRYAQEAADLSEQLKIPVDAMIYVYMAKAYGRIPDNENALLSFKTALTIATGRKDTVSMASQKRS
jgi:hypothetical protein